MFGKSKGNLYRKTKTLKLLIYIQSIIHLSEQLKTKPHPNTTRASISGTGLSFVYSEGLLVSLLEITVNSDQQKDVKCRQIIYEAIASIIMYSNQVPTFYSILKLPLVKRYIYKFRTVQKL
jgi:hypothetical protein